MSKEETITEIKNWIKDNFPDKEIAFIGMESIHASGQENFAIYDANENKIIQENDYKNPDSKNHREFEYEIKK